MGLIFSKMKRPYQFRMTTTLYYRAPNLLHPQDYKDTLAVRMVWLCREQCVFKDHKSYGHEFLINVLKQSFEDYHGSV